MKPQASSQPIRRLCVFCTLSTARHHSASTSRYFTSTAATSSTPSPSPQPQFGAFSDHSTPPEPQFGAFVHPPPASPPAQTADSKPDAASSPFSRPPPTDLVPEEVTKQEQQKQPFKGSPRAQRPHSAVENYYNGRSASGYTRLPQQSSLGRLTRPPAKQQASEPTIYPRGQDPVSQAIQNFRHEIAGGPSRSIPVPPTRSDPTKYRAPNQSTQKPRIWARQPPRPWASARNDQMESRLPYYAQEMQKAGRDRPVARHDVSRRDRTDDTSAYSSDSAALSWAASSPELRIRRRVVQRVQTPWTAKEAFNHNQNRSTPASLQLGSSLRPNQDQSLSSSSVFSGWSDSSTVPTEAALHGQQEKRATTKSNPQWNDVLTRFKAQRSQGTIVDIPKAKRMEMDMMEKFDKPVKKKHVRRSRDEDEDEDEDEDADDVYERSPRRRYIQDHEEWIRQKEERRQIREARIQEAAERRALQVHLPPYLSNAHLARMLNLQFNDFAETAQKLGLSQTSPDHILTAEDAGLISMELGFEPIFQESGTDLVGAPWPWDVTDLLPRPPVVTIMGHVDHGKTTILDYLRKSSIAANEHGGITQHIGAFSVHLSSGRTITFLDTPGHAAFLDMRQRGANVTDIVVLVVAADDGVMPQTIEAIKHAKAAKVPIIVAINKVDKSDANIDRVKQDMARQNVDLEDFGGDVQVVPVSGKTGQGMKDLEENIITLSEILDHRAPVVGNVEGWVLEASTKAHGRVATVLVRRGVLKPGAVFVAGQSWTRVKTLRNEFGTIVEYAGPGSPVEIDGWRNLPLPGDEFLQAEDEKQAASVLRSRLELAGTARHASDVDAINESRRVHREERVAREIEDPLPWYRRRHRDSKLEGIFRDRRKNSGTLEAFFVIKADVGGSVEAVVNLVSSLGNNQVRPHIIRSGAGVVTESDVELADVAGGYILAFNTDIEQDIRKGADYKGVPIIEHSIIYRIADDVNRLLEDMLPEIVSQRVTGEAEILQLFTISVKGNKKLPIAGCRIRNGTASKGSRLRVIRHGETVHDGTLSSLKNHKKDVTEMKKDSECGMSFGEWSEFEIGDQIQCYTEIREKAKLQGGS